MPSCLCCCSSPNPSSTHKATNARTARCRPLEAEDHCGTPEADPNWFASGSDRSRSLKAEADPDRPRSCLDPTTNASSSCLDRPCLPSLCPHYQAKRSPRITMKPRTIVKKTRRRRRKTSSPQANLIRGLSITLLVCSAGRDVDHASRTQMGGHAFPARGRSINASTPTASQGERGGALRRRSIGMAMREREARRSWLLLQPRNGRQGRRLSPFG